MKHLAAKVTLHTLRLDAPRLSTIVVLAAYFAYYGTLMIKGHGVPYVMDNNETYSALLHAHNFWNFDFFKSFGLADDVASPFASAHPVVHTHQGDFPRLFAAILYAFGARTAESQIWITTFTVGIASVLLAKKFFRRLAGDLFATIATLTLITDYLLFAQWQVNTYRVWHCFFLFASLVCVHGLSDWPRRRWALATVCLYACLFYWELVYASFVAVSSAVYTIWIYRRTRSLINLGILTQTLGAAFGLATLISQVLLYLGWNDFIADLELTYRARNFGDIAAIQQLKTFYDARNITFWYNIQPDTGVFRVISLLRSIFTYVLQIQTPLLVLVSFSLALSVLFAGLKWPAAREEKTIAHPRSDLRATAALAAGFFCLLVAVILSADLLGGRTNPALDQPIWLLIVISVSLPLSIVASIALRNVAGAASAHGRIPDLKRCGIAALYFVGLATFILVQGFLYDQAYQSFWFDLIAPAPAQLAKVVVCVAALMGGFLILVDRPALKDRSSSLVPFFVSGLVGYLFVYATNPGYLHSGYLYRLCPLAIFHINAFLALGPYAVIRLTTAIARDPQSSKLPLSSRVVTGIAASLAVALISYWGLLQYRYMTLLPPNQFSFAQSLNSLHFPAEGIVSNTYAAPFGIIAKTWAYMNADIGTNQETKLGRGKSTGEYLWFADRTSNLAYRTPAVFVCFEPMQYSYLKFLAKENSDFVPNCSNLRFEKLTRAGEKSNLQLVLIEQDKIHERWGIYQMRWKNYNNAVDKLGDSPDLVRFRGE